MLVEISGFLTFGKPCFDREGSCVGFVGCCSPYNDLKGALEIEQTLSLYFLPYVYIDRCTRYTSEWKLNIDYFLTFITIIRAANVISSNNAAKFLQHSYFNLAISSSCSCSILLLFLQDSWPFWRFCWGYPKWIIEQLWALAYETSVNTWVKY